MAKNLLQLYSNLDKNRWKTKNETKFVHRKTSTRRDKTMRIINANLGALLKDTKC